MEYSFGDIIDGRKDPAFGHFFVIVGTIEKGGEPIEILYYKIYSRVYTVFGGTLDFFNDCIRRRCPRFFHFFPKEKGKDKIDSYGNLGDVIFLDKEKYYAGCLDVDSMVIIKSGPDKFDYITLENKKDEGLVKYRLPLCILDIQRLINTIKYSDNVGAIDEMAIRIAYNKKVIQIKKYPGKWRS